MSLLGKNRKSRPYLPDIRSTPQERTWSDHRGMSEKRQQRKYRKGPIGYLLSASRHSVQIQPTKVATSRGYA